MEDWELRKYIGRRIRYDIGPHFEWKERAEGDGFLRYDEPHDWWTIELADGREFHLADEHVRYWIQFDKADQVLIFVYNP